MIAAHVSRRYARALLEIGLAAQNLDALVDEMSRMAQAYESSADLRAAASNPNVPLAAKKAILSDLSQQLGLGATAKNTLLLLADRRRLTLLPDIATLLREMNDARKGLVRVEVTVAAPLSDAFYTRLQATLEKLTSKRVTLDKKQDPALIGGVVVRIGDMVLDSSLKTRLDGLKNALLPN
jgi:F-type H+-transporting ATPase subunit delta